MSCAITVQNSGHKMRDVGCCWMLIVWRNGEEDNEQQGGRQQGAGAAGMTRQQKGVPGVVVSCAMQLLGCWKMDHDHVVEELSSTGAGGHDEQDEDEDGGAAGRMKRDEAR